METTGTAVPTIEEQLAEMRADRDRFRHDYLEACKTVAAMHAAATGKVGEGPRRGVVEDVEDLRAQKDGAYGERNKVVVALAHLALTLGWKAGVREHPSADASWEPDWRTVVFIDLPTGQVSWHFHDSEKPQLGGLPRYVGEWDGHSTDEKYSRLQRMSQSAAGTTSGVFTLRCAKCAGDQFATGADGGLVLKDGHVFHPGCV